MEYDAERANGRIGGYLAAMEGLLTEVKGGIESLISNFSSNFTGAGEGPRPREEPAERFGLPEPERPRTLEIAGAIFTDMPLSGHSGRPEEGHGLGVQMRKVPKEFLGYRVLGRAFPGLNIIEIADDLYGEDLEEVRLHELLHVQNPAASEYDVRSLTRAILGKTKWNR